MGTREQINSLINLVHSNAPRQALQAFLDDRFNDPNSISRFGTESPKEDVRLLRRYRSGRRRTGSIADLMNPPIQVPAKPWTSVTDDDDFVSHLMSLWFTWAHPWWQWVDKVLFLEAMSSQDLNNPLCTPYLVNMILADACLLDNMDEDEDEPHPHLRDQFYAEAKKGLEAEKGRISLTVVQTTGVQWTYLDMTGEDKLGLLVLNEQVFMAKELDKYQARLSKDANTSPETLSKVDRSISRLEWALFALNTFTLVGSRRTHTINPPRRPHPHHTHDDNVLSKNWFPYPRRALQLDFHEGCHFFCITSLARIAVENEILSMNSEDKQPESAESFGQRQKSKDWAISVPSCMKLHERAVPHVLALHILPTTHADLSSAMHNWIILILAKQAAAADAGQAGKPTIATTPSSATTPHWQQVSVSAAVTIGNLMDLLISKWGVENFPVILIHPISLALLTLLENVEHEDRRRAFVSMCVALRAASRRFRVGKGILKLVKNKAIDMGIILPKEVEQLFYFERRRLSDSTGTEKWEEAPVEEIGMQYLLEKWNDLDLDAY
ncbi:hypothetical protein H2198_001962 [Neophaeococcomyces mojaviensis]|uniref:Uncharacterized protein n=1 Tax=Neophaeococcomyces mojaviensis TaxID=3383035 RepID=A0ACC3AGA9_9EURO|nr:hypothetical protein H2198_001962 [Knufia sp. JES_112]